MTQVLTTKNCFKTLDSLRDKVKVAVSGCREQIYDSMGEAWLVVLLLRKDKKLRREFARRAKLKVSAKDRTKFKVVTEVMAYVMCAKTASKRKLAWKRGRIIQFLHGQGIKTSKIAAEIKSRGGIEAVLKQAVKHQPRRDKGSVGTKTGAKKSKPPMVNARDKQERDSPESNQSAVVPAKSAGGWRRNNQQVILPVVVNLSDRDMLDELPVGSRLRIAATRTNEKGAKMEINRIEKLKSEVCEENDNEWE